MRIEHLREFIELSKCLNFTSAAKTLHITQPALSNHVHALETETGVLLIKRSANEHARLTPAGLCFLNMAMNIIALCDETLPKLKEIQQDMEGEIVIRSPRYEYSKPFLDHLYEFQKLHPHISVVLHPWADIDGVEDVMSGKVDFAIAHPFEYENDSLRYQEIGFVPYSLTELFLWMNEAHPLAASEHLRLDDLDGHTLLVPSTTRYNSWKNKLVDIIKNNGLSCSIVERYCSSLEDLILNRVSPDDLLLCDAGLIEFPPLKLRKDRTIKRFSPHVYTTLYACYKLDGDNPAIPLFADFLARTYHENEVLGKDGEI